VQARPAPAECAPRAPRRAAVRVLAHGAVGAAELKKQGFIGEMRAVAMKLHTRDQAPKEGGQKASEKPMPMVRRRRGRGGARRRAGHPGGLARLPGEQAEQRGHGTRTRTGRLQEPR
jgi:hypothetical protein